MIRVNGVTPAMIRCKGRNLKSIRFRGAKIWEHNHAWNNGTCSTCGKVCSHAWNDGTCTICGKVCTHENRETGTFECPDCGKDWYPVLNISYIGCGETPKITLQKVNSDNRKTYFSGEKLLAVPAQYYVYPWTYSAVTLKSLLINNIHLSIIPGATPKAIYDFTGDTTYNIYVYYE